MTNGEAYGTSGAERQAFWRAYALIWALMVAICVVNTLTVVQDRARAGAPVPAWEPAVWESTSGVTIMLLILALYPIVLSAVRRWPRWAAAILAVGLPVFSVLHVAGMVAERWVIYRLVGGSYPLSLADFPYEFRKDAVTYAILATVLWVWRRAAHSGVSEAAQQPPDKSGTVAQTFDIRDGARTLRVAPADIVAVTSAGNYVEFVLADGRRPLMRSTLAAIEASLAPHGLVRTHRSWLVNPAAVRVIEPERSGDRMLELQGGVRAPVSRRFPEALARLRGVREEHA